MNVKIQSLKFTADQKLIAFIEEKVSKLTKYSEGMISADVILKLDKDLDHGNKVAVVKIEAAGDDLVAERQCKSFEEAIDQCVDALKKQVEKYKSREK